MIGEKAMAWNLRERKLNKYHQIISCSVVEQKLENKGSFLKESTSKKYLCGS